MIRYGWVCPKCQKVNNPDNRLCAGACQYPDFQQAAIKEAIARGHPPLSTGFDPTGGQFNKIPWSNGASEEDL